MKIYILTISPIFRPASQKITYPPHNTGHFGVEQDFHHYLLENPALVTGRPEEADWHYLPIYWTSWHLNLDDAQTGLPELQQQIDQAILDDRKTFTICQYADGPLAHLGQTTLFLASRRTEQGLDIPLLSKPHRLPMIKPRKKYLASFAGRFSTHPLRQKMSDHLANRDDVCIFDSGKKGKNRMPLMKRISRRLQYQLVPPNLASELFVKNMLESYIALCPRGYGGSSFRFFEAMQLGVVPYLIGDIDTRPFKAFIPWDELSLYSRCVSELSSVLDRQRPDQLIAMGRKIARFNKENLAKRQWCQYVIKELRNLSS